SPYAERLRDPEMRKNRADAAPNYDMVVEAARLLRDLQAIHLELIARERRYDSLFNDLLMLLTANQPDFSAIHGTWGTLRRELLAFVAPSPHWPEIKRSMDQIEAVLSKLQKAAAQYQFRLQTAAEFRRPLDHRKFLD